MCATPESLDSRFFGYFSAPENSTKRGYPLGFGLEFWGRVFWAYRSLRRKLRGECFFFSLGSPLKQVFWAPEKSKNTKRKKGTVFFHGENRVMLDPPMYIPFERGQ
jgi:hypothetical protein